MHLNKDQDISIEWQELFPIVVACAIWFPYFTGKRIQFWCDNKSVVAILNSGRSRAPRIMDLLRFLVVISMKHNFFIRACHVPGLSNEIADALSHFPGSCSNSRANPLHHPAFAHDPLKDEVTTYANWGLAWTTNRMYTSGEKHFIQFCLMNRLISNEGDILPASEGTLIYFSSYLARKVKHSTIKLYLAAVRNFHISCGYGDPLLGKLLLKKVLRGILRYQGHTRALRQPVTPRVLLAIRPILLAWLGERDFSMIWAAFAFFCFLRCSEFTYQGVSKFRPQFDLSADCVLFHPSLASPRQMSIILKSSKTDVFREGHQLLITLLTLTTLRSVCHSFIFSCGVPSGPLFTFQSGRCLTRSAVVHLLRDAARSAGLPSKSLKGHSFHIGAASTAVAAGLPDWLIKVLDRWSSDCYQLYIRTPKNVLMSAAPRMASILDS